MKDTTIVIEETIKHLPGIHNQLLHAGRENASTVNFVNLGRVPELAAVSISEVGGHFTTFKAGSKYKPMELVDYYVGDDDNPSTTPVAIVGYHPRAHYGGTYTAVILDGPKTGHIVTVNTDRPNRQHLKPASQQTVDQYGGETTKYGDTKYKVTTDERHIARRLAEIFGGSEERYLREIPKDRGLYIKKVGAAVSWVDRGGDPAVGKGVIEEEIRRANNRQYYLPPIIDKDSPTRITRNSNLETRMGVGKAALIYFGRTHFWNLAGSVLPERLAAQYLTRPIDPTRIKTAQNGSISYDDKSASRWYLEDVMHTRPGADERQFDTISNLQILEWIGRKIDTAGFNAVHPLVIDGVHQDFRLRDTIDESWASDLANGVNTDANVVANEIAQRRINNAARQRQMREQANAELTPEQIETRERQRLEREAKHNTYKKPDIQFTKPEGIAETNYVKHVLTSGDMFKLGSDLGVCLAQNLSGPDYAERNAEGVSSIFQVTASSGVKSALEIARANDNAPWHFIQHYALNGIIPGKESRAAAAEFADINQMDVPKTYKSLVSRIRKALHG